MANITGSAISAGFRQGSTYGTAVAIGTGHKGIFESINDSVSTTIGDSVGIGSGLSMDNSADKLREDVTINVNQQARYNDGIMPLLLASFLGVAGTPTEQTLDEDDYLHTITFSPTADKFLTFARTVTTTETFEYPSCHVTGINFSLGEVPGYLTYSCDLVADSRVLDSSTNTTTTLNAATVLGSSIISAGTADYLWMNAQAGDALDSSDAISYVESLDISFERPKSINYSLGGSRVLVDDKLEVTLTLNFGSIEDLTHFTNYSAGTEQKALISVTGDQINAGESENISFYFPRLIAVDSPTTEASNAGVNPQSVTYKGLVAASNPTGMSNTYPYVTILNGNSAAILA